MRPPPVETTAHAVHLVLPPAHAVMVPPTHSSSPYHESEDGEAQRPPPDETENHQRDPGWLSKLIDPCCDRHGGASLMNVNNIYIAPSNCQEGNIRVGRLLHGRAPQTIVRWRPQVWLQLVQDRASRPALRPPEVLRVISAMFAAPRRRDRTARQCRVTSTRCEEQPSRLGGETATGLAHTGSRKRHGGRQMPARRLHAIRHYQAEFRLQTLL